MSQLKTRFTQFRGLIGSFLAFVLTITPLPDILVRGSNSTGATSDEANQRMPYEAPALKVVSAFFGKEARADVSA